jgi:hypothetical protein
MRNETQVAEQITRVEVKGMCYEDVAFDKLIGFVLYFFLCKKYLAYIK